MRAYRLALQTATVTMARSAVRAPALTASMIGTAKPVRFVSTVRVSKAVEATSQRVVMSRGTAPMRTVPKLALFVPTVDRMAEHAVNAQPIRTALIMGLETPVSTMSAPRHVVPTVPAKTGSAMPTPATVSNASKMHSVALPA